MFSTSASHQLYDAGLRQSRSVVIDYLLNNFANENTKVAYIYCNYKDQAAQTASNIIACLIRQIIGTTKALPQQLEVLYKDLKDQDRRPSIEELKRLLVALCAQYKSTYIIVDALDECEAVHRRLLLPIIQFLPDVLTKLFVTSRPNNEDIFQSFGAAPQVPIVATELDLRAYIMESMEERGDSRLTPELKEEMTSTICARASGMYDPPYICCRRTHD